MGSTPTASAAAWAQLRARFSGELIRPDDAAYDAARRVWNAAVERHPGVIARCETADDVATAVRWARDHEATVAVRCGGHSVAGLSTCDDGIVIDLSPLRRIEVDGSTGIASVGGGSLLKDVDEAAQRFGLACPTGVVGHTGVAGLTLGGGIGRLSRAHGLSLDNLISLDLVTTDGRHVRASEDENPDLFWGMRGAGANFGIVTNFTFQLVPIGTQMFAGMALYPIERAAEIAEVFQAWAEQAPRTAIGKMTLTRAGEGPPFPEALAGRPAVFVGASVIGLGEAAEAAVQPLREHGPLLDLFGERSYLQLQTMNDDVMRWGLRYYWKGMLVDELPEATVEDGVALLHDSPVASAEIGAMTLGGAISDVDEDATAFSGRQARYWQSVEIDWEDPALDERCMAWGRKAMAPYLPFATGRNYVNDLNEPHPDAVRNAYGPDKYDRLVALKRTWDPDNVLRLNQNIRP